MDCIKEKIANIFFEFGGKFMDDFDKNKFDYAIEVDDIDIYNNGIFSLSELLKIITYISISSCGDKLIVGIKINE